MPRLRWAFAAALAAGACTTSQSDDSVPVSPATSGGVAARTKGRTVADFAVDAVYTDDRGGVLGTRWVHKTHGMPVTVLRIQSVPQVFLAFNTPPVSDRGEPHTGEHLLLGKGTKGKALSAEQDMSLVQSTAWTSQTDVCYSWSCAAGKETFFRSVEQYLDALLLPDYGDEEIRREVCHVGPVKDEKSGALSVDEKGTIYQEMTSSYEKRWIVYDELQTRLWGREHPLSFSSGGEPSAVRKCEPQHVHEFHAAHYHLAADTQMIVALPDSIPDEEFLTRLSAQMAEVDARPEMKARTKTVHSIPPGRPDPDKSLVVVPYPNANEGDGGMAIVAWTPVARTSQADRVAGDLLLATLGSGESATLYKRLMDSATREVEVGAGEMGASLDASKIDLLPNVWFDQLPPRSATKERMGEIVRVIRDEIARVAALAEGSKELAAFNEKALVKLTEREKDLKKQLNSPPLFGHRLAGGFWLDHLRLLDEDASFERSVTLAPVFANLRAEIARGANPWTRIVAALGLSGEPYVAVSVASKAELEKRTADHAKRVEGYVADIAKRSGMEPQAALAKFAAEYDVKTEELDEIEKRLPKPHLVADVPLVPDPSIKLEPVEAGGAKGFRAVFDNMTFAETSVSFPVAASDDDLPWLAILPALLTDSGVVIDGRPLPYDQAAERRAKEIYALSAEWSMRPSRGRHELRVTASGADLAEAKRAIEWIDLCLAHAWIAEENLPRLRDLVAQEIQSTRGRLGGSEENWVRDPAGAVRWQRDPVFLSTSSIHAKLFQLARCEWRLMDAPPAADAAKVEAGLGAIVACAAPDLKTTAGNVAALVAKWKESKDEAAVKWLVPIGQRICEMVGDMAPTTIARDLAALTDTCRADLAIAPGNALGSAVDLIRAVRSFSPRFVLTGSRANEDELLKTLGPVVRGWVPAVAGTRTTLTEFEAHVVVAESAPGAPLVDQRLRDHESGEGAPLCYGLVHNAGTSGVFVLSAKAAGLDDVGEATLTDELAARVFGGSGAHAFFMKTWGAGLAYSNGLSTNPNEGRINYYAERCPDLVQTITFVTGLVKDAASLADPYLAEYCVANAVAYSRESDRYEQRARAAADDVTDGDTPERVSRWRGAVLAMKDRAGLWDAMKPRIGAMTGRVLPGVGPKRADVEGALWFTIAPEPMLARWESYLSEHDAKDARVARIYGRDFWMVPAR
jgi:Zn-dependent M16 (insulinase) family peptidase